ncbi:hypothetical protein EJ05DRAFT_78892 [Pseudovirgaria hyperparasitica]|uniref:Uncharacterized protein n=1 Tax=Pseudovirgaria hyperparasitica TaxID=470096 RepID=A0A6A6W2J9_9PEZI|nr:uncharacterized protein EJ05DRAFT_78892 [Pseudovirgaria hyperparasitica]KAF2755817.1 hypothetical protein EJ05DRAFT_78892 [Pseudovirgaria hyperparasitica]
MSLYEQGFQRQCKASPYPHCSSIVLFFLMLVSIYLSSQSNIMYETVHSSLLCTYTCWCIYV